jgi:hypothetical protein
MFAEHRLGDQGICCLLAVVLGKFSSELWSGPDFSGLNQKSSSKFRNLLNRTKSPVQGSTSTELFWVRPNRLFEAARIPTFTSFLSLS